MNAATYQRQHSAAERELYKAMARLKAAEQAARAALPPDLPNWIYGECWIEEPQGSATGLIPFHLWPAQQSALDVLVKTKQVIILKARQLGLSWLVIAYAVWLCLFHKNKTVLVFSKDQDSANEIVRRAGVIWRNLKEKVAKQVVDNQGEIAWENGSRIKSFAATEHAGSSFTASLIILDEFAKMRFPESIYTSVKPTVADGGAVIVVSTAQGQGDLFSQLWEGALKKQNSFAPIFIPWNARPGRDATWYARAASDAVSEAHHRQEYPANAEEAFTVVGEERFLPSMILWDACREDLPPLGAREPMVLAADAAVTGDSWGLLGVTRHPARRNDVAIRYCQEWKPPTGGQIDFLGTEERPGPERMIRKLKAGYNVVQLAYDPYQMADMAQRLTREQVIWCKPFNQAGDRLEADKQLLDLILSKRLAHDGNATLRQHIDNANRKPDAETHKLRIVKRASALKIDLAVCASMASAECLRLAI